MDALADNIAQSADHHALALQPRFADKFRAADMHGKMRFPTAIIAHMAVMFRAVIDNIERYRCEYGEAFGHNIGHGRCGFFCHGLYIGGVRPLANHQFR